VAACGDPGALCSGIADCCGDLICTELGLCEEARWACSELSDGCAVDDDCCTGICCGGTCVAAECCSGQIGSCGDGFACMDGVCVEVRVRCTDGGECDDATCCCADGTCAEACCPEVESVADPASDDSFFITALPNTGNGGRRDPGLRTALLTALGSGGAVALGRWIGRAQESD
jgi:hypothetical protein